MSHARHTCLPASHADRMCVQPGVLRSWVILVSAVLVASATVARPAAMDCSMSWMTLALSTADQRVDSGVNQLLAAAASSTAVTPLTRADRPVLFGTRPL